VGEEKSPVNYDASGAGGGGCGGEEVSVPRRESSIVIEIFAATTTNGISVIVACDMEYHHEFSSPILTITRICSSHWYPKRPGKPLSFPKLQSLEQNRHVPPY